MLRHIILVGTLLLTVIAAGCTSQVRSETDTDSDGLGDEVEKNGWTITVTRKDGPETFEVDSDPKKRDTDGDGLEDFDEKARGTDPRDVDTDADGLVDGYNLVVAVDSSVATTLRARGIIEQPPGTFLGELDQCRPRGVLDSHVWSSDKSQADKLGDGEEILGWNATIRGQAVFVTSDPCVPDTDEDGATDDEEKALGSHPRVADTDGDGVRDGQDADPVWNLGLSLTNMTANRSDGRNVSVQFDLGAYSKTMILSPGRGEAHIDVNDSAPNREHLITIGQLFAMDTESGEPVLLFQAGHYAILKFDLVEGTLTTSDGVAHRDSITFSGTDGAIAFDWQTTRT